MNTFPILIGQDRVLEPLYAIVPLFNPFRWKSRFKHVTRALKHFHDSGVVIVFVEIAFNRREFVFSNLGLDGTLASCEVLGEQHKFRHKHIQLRTKDELWLKENAINVGVAMGLPYDWKQVCWLDCDVNFLRPNWVGETIQQLQHYKFVQMFSHARDLGVNYEMLSEDYPHANGEGFVYHHDPHYADRFHRHTFTKKKDEELTPLHDDGYYYGAGIPRVWPGLAWACTREGWDDVGGLIDFAVWGGGDWHMAHALIEKQDQMMRSDLHPNYKAKVNAWLEHCTKDVRRNVGVVEGSIVHHWHGRKTERGYNAKHSLLANIGFDPIRHLKRDYQGLWQLHDDGSEAFIRLRDSMRVIAKERNEDSIDE